MRRLIIVPAALLILAVITGYAAEKKPQEVGFTDPNKAIQITKQAQKVILKLKSNPTTGYSWLLVHYDPNLVEPISRKYVAPKSQSVGAPGYEVWRFAVNAKAFVVPQMTEITLQYARPWLVPTNGRKLKFTVIISPLTMKKIPMKSNNK